MRMKFFARNSGVFLLALACLLSAGCGTVMHQVAVEKGEQRPFGGVKFDREIIHDIRTSNDGYEWPSDQAQMWFVFADLPFTALADVLFYPHDAWGVVYQTSGDTDSP